jgi:hypothetical protein
MARIYCRTCRYFEEICQLPFSYNHPDYDELKERCMSPNNFKDTYREELEYPISIPSIINRFCDCVWYDEIEQPSSSSSSD